MVRGVATVNIESPESVKVDAAKAPDGTVNIGVGRAGL